MHQEITDIWHQFNKELLKFIFSKVKNEDISKDILQEVFIKIHLNLDSLRQKDKLTSWVYNITRNAINDYFRNLKNQKSENIDIENLEDVLSDNSFENNKLLDEVTKSDIHQCLTPFIKELNEEYQYAIKSTIIDGISQKDFAKEIGISYSGAKSRVQRAKTGLFNKFVNCCKVHLDSRGNIMDF